MIVIDLPFPPSVNAAYGNNKGSGRGRYRTPAYESWIKQAGLLWLTQRPSCEIKTIIGHYTLKIVLNPPTSLRRRDLGNFEKPLSDFIVSHGVVEDDSLCLSLALVWGSMEDAPYGVRLFIDMPNT